MLRLDDWCCTVCGLESEHYVDVPLGDSKPRQEPLPCLACNGMTEHDRMIAAPAPLLAPCNPVVSGGTFDTMGHRQPPPLPVPSWADDHGRKAESIMSTLPDNASAEDKRAAWREAGKDAPKEADYAQHFESKEWKHARAEGDRIKQQNAQKRKRANAMRRGENVNMRNDKCAGDPNITA